MPANLCLDNTCTRVVAPTSLSVRGATRSQIKPSSVRLVAVMRIHVQLLQQTRSSLKFVPPSRHVTGRDVSQLQDFLAGGGRLLVITGAGLSTESGIPDYRSDGVGLYARSTRRPMNFQEFLKSHEARKRYWARNFVGWPQFSSFQPNSSHKALSAWERDGHLQWLVTQNVDALHTKAGSEHVTELHGCTHRVVCLACGNLTKRWDLQKAFQDVNPDFKEESVEIAPDGDVQLSENQVKGFQVPECAKCGGILKPDVVFFGDNVPRPKVNQVFDYVDKCDKILVAGSSLYVYSAYRFIQRGVEGSKRIAIVNIGPTRGDEVAHLKIAARCGDVLPRIQL